VRSYLLWGGGDGTGSCHLVETEGLRILLIAAYFRARGRLRPATEVRPVCTDGYRLCASVSRPSRPRWSYSTLGERGVRWRGCGDAAHSGDCQGDPYRLCAHSGGGGLLLGRVKHAAGGRRLTLHSMTWGTCLIVSMPFAGEFRTASLFLWATVQRWSFAMPVTY